MTLKNHNTLTKNKRNTNTFLLPILSIIYLILLFMFPYSSLSGAKSGLLLWFNTIVPTLLPCIIISNLIISLDITKYICFLFSPILTRFFGISKAGCYPVIIGFLSGFPLGAKTCSDMMNQGKLSDHEGQYISALCNNASYMFITSYIAVSSLQLPNYQYQLLGILYLSTILSSFLYKITYAKKRKSKLVLVTSLSNSTITTDDISTTITPSKFSFKLVDDAIMDGFEVITKIGGYIILFSILAKIITDIGSNHRFLTYLFVGLMEITTGVNSISQSALDGNTKIVLMLSITAFGGLSSIAQTKSVISNSRLSIKTYTMIKLLNMFITALLTTIYVAMVF